MPQNIPYNLEAEQAVLGCIIIDNEVFQHLSDSLAATDFYDRRHQIIYTAMDNIFNSDRVIDYTTLIAELQIKNQLEDAGGAIYLASLIDAVYTTANVDDYANIVIDAATKRKVIAAATSIGEAGYDPKYSSADYLDYAERIIMDLSKRRKSDDLVPVKKVVESVNETIIANRNRSRELTGLTTGFARFDSVTLGLQKQNLIILAARPAMGKSAFAMNIALNAASSGITDNGTKPSVAFFSLEMSEESIVQRMLAATAKVNLKSIQKGDLNDKELTILRRAKENLSDLNIYFSDQGMITIADIRAKCRKQKIDKGLDLVVIDYLQLISSQGKSRAQSRQEEVSAISRALKQMARELDVPVIALAQLSRDVEKRENKMPQMADLRESGSIEQDADIVLFLYRDEYYKKENAGPNIAELIVAKNRNGVSGREADIKFLFQGEYQLFTPYSGN